MGFRRSFIAGLLWRLLIVVAVAWGVILALQTPGLGAARLLSFLIFLGVVWELWRFVQRTNLELARFVDAVRYGDVSQRFSHKDEGSGFGEVGEAMNRAMQALREERMRQSDEARYLGAVLDDTPVPLVTVDRELRVDLANKAARRLLMRHTGVRIDDFAEYGEAFARSLAEVEPGRSRVVPLILDGVPQSAVITASTVHRLGGSVRLIAVQPIQGELNAIEIAAQSDLIRVLTHEIMNSITPVTSLAHTAAGLIAEVDRGDEPVIADARAAVETLARRADGVMHFVETYRQIARTPQLRRRQFEAMPWAREIHALFRASDASAGVALHLDVTPEKLLLDADPDLLFQVLLNLLRNGAEAARSHSDEPELRLTFALASGGRTRIEVADNGPGVPEQLQQDVFLPFFTTKEKGTGVGLSLARQVVLAHGGSINLLDRPGGGALFRILI